MAQLIVELRLPGGGVQNRINSYKIHSFGRSIPVGHTRHGFCTRIFSLQLSSNIKLSERSMHGGHTEYIQLIE